MVTAASWAQVTTGCTDRKRKGAVAAVCCGGGRSLRTYLIYDDFGAAYRQLHSLQFARLDRGDMESVIIISSRSGWSNAVFFEDSSSFLGGGGMHELFPQLAGTGKVSNINLEKALQGIVAS